MNRLSRRHVVIAAAAAATLGMPARARAQGRSLRILVGCPAGGGTDAIARLLGEAL
jgi:tripartite-type tricarboxylate transporter receptor subunit TctC